MSDPETHPVPESVDPGGWELTVAGLVDRPLSLDPEDLRSMELVRASGDFSCVEGWTATDLTWRGVRAMDGEHACGYPLDRLDGALLALELDGDPLVEHGGPARLVPATPDSDCWESVKWVDRMEPSADEPDDTVRALALSRLD